MSPLAVPAGAQGRPNKPVLHGKHWVAITGKPLGATAGAMTFQQGGNAVDAACAMLAATSTMWDTLGWGGETQALIYNPHTGEVIGVDALGVAPTGATADFFRDKGIEYPPSWGPLAAVTPGTPGGLMTMLAEWGTLSLAEVLEPAIQMARGYPIEAQAADRMESSRDQIEEWPYSKAVFLPHLVEGSDGAEEERAAPYAGEMFVQPDLARTLEKLVEAERAALDAGKSRKQAIYAAYDRFYKGDIAEEIARSTQEQGGLITREDLARWQVKIEKPVTTDYHGYRVHKLTTWTQGPVLLQTLNILEGFDLEAMGYNSARYIHTLYQAMNLAYADRDFYYGDPYVPPEEPVAGLLSKDYAKARAATIDPDRNDPDVAPGDPYAFQEGENPYKQFLDLWPAQFGDENEDADGGAAMAALTDLPRGNVSDPPGREAFYAGTTSIQAADEEGWVVSVTPSGAWVPAVIAGKTGIGLSQRMQSFVVDERENPYNVVTPGQRPRVTLTPDDRHQGRQAVGLGGRPGRRHPGPEHPPVPARHDPLPDERPGGDRGGQLHQLPDGELLRRARAGPGGPAAQCRHATVGAQRAPADGLPPELRRPHLRPDQRDLVRPRPRHPVGRQLRLRRRLRRLLVR